MAYNFVPASTQYLSTASAPVTAKPVTMVCFARPTSGNNDFITVQIGTNSTNNRFVQYVSSARASGTQINDTGASTIATSQTVANGTWRHSGSTFPDATEIAAFIDGQKTSNNVTRSPTGIDRMAIGARTTGDFITPGDVAEVAVWNVALTDAEIASLAKGFKPTRIRPQSLVFYAPLIRELQDVKGALTLTNNNSATVAAHPRVY